MKIGDIMNRVATVEKDLKLIEVAKILSKENISSLVYILNGKAKGIITERDIIRNIEHLKSKNISDVMTKKLITIDYEDDLEEAAELMHKKKIKRLLVVDERDDLIGIITATDILANADMLNKILPFFD